MKTIVIAFLFFCVAGGRLIAQAPAAKPAPPTQAPKTAPATHVTKQQIQDFFAQMPKNRILDNVIRAVDVGGYRVGVFAVTRPKDS